MDQGANGLPPPPAAAVDGAEKNLIRRSSYKNSVRYHRYVEMVPANRLKRRHANREIVRRALAPPSQKPSIRWRNFCPTPSRLCNMSTA